MATSFPLPSRSAARRRECPPAPKVASTTVSPGCTARSARTSSTRTGTWSAAFVRKTFGNIAHAPFDRAALDVPLRSIPDLDVVVDSGDDDVASEPGVLDELLREEDAPLRVELGHECPAEDVSLHLARLRRERVEIGDASDVRLPAVERVDVDVRLDPAREHH